MWMRLLPVWSLTRPTRPRWNRFSTFRLLSTTALPEFLLLPRQSPVFIKPEHPTIFEILDKLSDHLDLRTKIEESIRKDEVIVEDEVAIEGRFVQILISPVKDNKNEPIGSVVLFHDVTHEKEVEKMREDFTSMMVHELRSPLTGIRSIATLLKNEQIKNE